MMEPLLRGEMYVNSLKLVVPAGRIAPAGLIITVGKAGNLFPGMETQSASPAHAVHFYDGDVRRLAPGVCRYLAEGMRRGEGAIVIARDSHRLAFARQLATDGIDTQSAVQQARLVLLDADATLASFMLRGMPDWEHFKAAIEPALEEVKAGSANGRVRAYGEMVDLLWSSGYSAAATLLEQFWNRLLAARGFSLYCAYQIDVFGKEFQGSVLDSVLCEHTHVLAADGHLEHALGRALQDVLGSRAEGIQGLMKDNFRPAWAAIPCGEAKVLWIRNNLPAHADEILARARGYYLGENEQGNSLSAFCVG